MAVEMISWQISTKECTGPRIKPQPSDYQAEAHPAEVVGSAHKVNNVLGGIRFYVVAALSSCFNNH